MTPEMRSEFSKSAKEIWAKRSPEERSEYSKKAWASRDPDDIVRAVNKTAATKLKKSELIEELLSKLVREIELTDEEWKVLVKKGYCDDDDQ